MSIRKIYCEIKVDVKVIIATIVTREKWLWNAKILCCMFLFTSLALSVHKAQQL